MDFMPTIKKDKKDEEKQKGGFLANLVKGAASKSAGFPGLGGVGGLGGRLLSSGILATKAGVVGLVLTATTVAGGLGFLGYKMFGPNASDQVGASYSLFTPRPIAEQKAIEAQQKTDDGNSASLNDLAKANPNALGDKSGSSASAGDASKAGQSDSSAAAEAAKAAAAKTAAAAAVAGEAPKKDKFNGNKIGELSKFGAGASGAAGAGASFNPSTLLASAARAGGSSSPSHSQAAAAHAAAGRRFGGGFDALTQAGQVLGDQQTQYSSAGTGGTVDGSKHHDEKSGGGGGGGGSTIAGGGSPTNLGGGPNGSTGSSQFPSPPPCPTCAGMANVTPWQNAMTAAEVWVVAAALIMWLVGKNAKTLPPAVVLAAGVVVAAIGAHIMSLGAQVMGGQFGQTLQGELMIAAGGALLGGGVAMAAMANSPDLASTMKTIMILSGAAAIGAMIVTYFEPAQTYPPTEFTNGAAPDIHHV